MLATPTEYSSKPLRDQLKRMCLIALPSRLTYTPRPEAAQKANQVFLPVLENASKAQKLRTTLGVFERSKFFFNLPSFIIESIEAVLTPCFYVVIDSTDANTRAVMKWRCEITRRANTS